MQLTKNQEEQIEAERLYWRDMNESLTLLHENEHFKKVILNGYFTDKAVQGVSMLANESVKRNNERTNLMESLIAISSLREYFQYIRSLGGDFDEQVQLDLEEEMEESNG